MKRIRSSLTYANVISTLCLFLLLGGEAAIAATKLAKNSVGTKQLKNNAVTAAKIKNKAVTGAKLDLATIASVPRADSASHADSATHADAATRSDSANSAGNAQTVAGMSPAQLTAQSKLQCPAGTLPAGGSCFDASQRPAADFVNALNICGNAGMALPAMGEIAAYMTSHPAAVEENWTDSLSIDELSFRSAFVNQSSGKVNVGVSIISLKKPFRCETQPTN